MHGSHFHHPRRTRHQARKVTDFQTSTNLNCNFQKKLIPLLQPIPAYMRLLFSKGIPYFLLPNLDSVNHCTSKYLFISILISLLVQWLTESRFGKTKFGIPIEKRSLMSAGIGCMITSPTIRILIDCVPNVFLMCSNVFLTGSRQRYWQRRQLARARARSLWHKFSKVKKKNGINKRIEFLEMEGTHAQKSCIQWLYGKYTVENTFYREHTI